MRRFTLLLCALMVFVASGAARAAMSDGEFINLCQTGSAAEVRSAIQSGANANAKVEGNGFTALIVAAGFNADPEVITALIDAGADVHIKDEYGMTALMWAAWKNPNPETVTALVNAGADVNARNGSGMTALDMALKNDKLRGTDALKLLERKPSSMAMNYRDFLRLCSSGSAEEVRDAIQAGVNVNAETEDDPTAEQGRTALMWAAQYNGDPGVIAALVEAGANVNAQDRDGRTALLWAAQYNKNPKVITALIEAGANVNAQDKDGRTALMAAATRNKKAEIVTALLDAGADVSVKDREGQTALRVAEARGKNTDAVAALANAGANADYTTGGAAPDQGAFKGAGPLTLPDGRINIMTVEQLGTEFLDNPFRAERERAGKRITIEGKIASLGIDSGTGEPAIVFEHRDGDQTVRVKCLVLRDDPLLMEVSRGGNVAVQGAISTFDWEGVIVIRECRILK